MTILRREGCYLLCNRKLRRFCWGLILPLLLPAVSLGAAEGTAQLTFQKLVSRNDQHPVYIVKKGDVIARIVRKLGWPAPHRYRLLKELNPQIPDLNKIHPGQKLLLPPPEQPEGAADDARGVAYYTAKKGDSVTRIIIAELHAKPPQFITVFRSIKQLNPEITNFNKIYPGQMIKIPRDREGIAERGKPVPAAPAKSAEEEKALAGNPPGADRYLPVIRQVVEQLRGTVMTSGSYHIPLAESGQVTVDCTAMPVVELGDGTTVLLDFAGRFPDALAAVIRTHWKNYRVLKIVGGRPVAAVLQEMLSFSPSLRMVKMTAPLSFDGTLQVKLFLDWLITRELPAGDAPAQLGLIVAADDKSPPLPNSSIVRYARKRGIAILEIPGDKVRDDRREPDAIAPLRQIKGNNNDELLMSFLAYLGLEPLQNREVKIFAGPQDGFDLAIKAEYIVKQGGKTLLITKNKLPQQFSERLKQQGMTAFFLAPGATKLTILEDVLRGLDIPHQFALFSWPPPQEQTRVSVSFPALKIAGEKGAAYFIDYGMDRDIYELLAAHWKFNMIRY